MKWTNLEKCDVIIVTRNSVENVEAALNRVGVFKGDKRIHSKIFPIIAYPENKELNVEKISKFMLFLQCFPRMVSAEVCLVDDSHGKPKCEHERFNASAEQMLFEILPGVEVMRCERNAPYGKQGICNQPEMIEAVNSTVLNRE